MMMQIEIQQNNPHFILIYKKLDIYLHKNIQETPNYNLIF